MQLTIDKFFTEAINAQAMYQICQFKDSLENKNYFISLPPDSDSF